jgi:hypothetical protein
MSIFSKIRNAKKGANEHKRSASQESKTEGKKPVYHHVPTHAAQDALISSPYDFRDAVQPTQDHPHRSKTMTMRTGSDMYLQQGSKIPLRQKSAGDLSIQSVISQKSTTRPSVPFQPKDFEVPNPYGFHPHNKRGSGSPRSSRRNSTVTSNVTSKKGKSPLSNRISGQ